MSRQLKLIMVSELGADGTSIDLLNATGFTLAENGRSQPMPGTEPGTVIESLTVRALTSTHNGLATLVQGLAAMDKAVQDYAANPVVTASVWIREQLTNETGARQAFIKRIEYKPAGSYWDWPVDQDAQVMDYIITITRVDAWEPTAGSSYALGALSCLGGIVNYATYAGTPGAVPGDLDARLAALSLDGSSTGGGFTTYKFWAGFRSALNGTLANFISVWNFASASGLGYDANTTVSVADVTAISGNKSQSDFTSDATLIQRTLIQVSDIYASSKYNDARGQFVVLMRAKVTAAGTCRARMVTGLSYNGSAKAKSSRVSITSTSWQLYEMGTIQIPSPGRLPITGQILGGFCIAIEAERVTGTGKLDYDALILIPIDEGYVYGEGASITYTDYQTSPFIVYHHPDGTKQCIDTTWVAGLGYHVPYSSGVPRGTCTLPIGAGIMVLAGQTSTASVLGTEVVPTMTVVPRWKELRGSE